MTLTRKAPLYVHRVRLMHRAGHVEHATPSFGGRRQRACRHPCCAMRAASLGVSTQISTISGPSAKKPPRPSRVRRRRGKAHRSRVQMASAQRCVVFHMGLYSNVERRCRLPGRSRPRRRRQQAMVHHSIVVSHVTSTALARSSNVKNARHVSIPVGPFENIQCGSCLYHTFRCVWYCRSWFSRVLDVRPLPKRKDRGGLARTSTLLILSFIGLTYFHRILIVCFVLGPSVTAKKRQTILQPTRFCAFVNLLRVRVGCTLHVQCLCPRCHSPTPNVCALSRVSARFPRIAGPRCVAVSLILSPSDVLLI
jgi:hypothetical protein